MIQPTNVGGDAGIGNFSRLQISAKVGIHSLVAQERTTSRECRSYYAALAIGRLRRAAPTMEERAVIAGLKGD